MHTSILSSALYKFFTALAAVAVVFASLPASPALAASTGFQSPTSCASATWTNPNNALTSNDVRTTAGNDGNTIECSFNLPAIPGGNLIFGIEVTVEGSATINRDVNVDLSWNGGGGYTGGDPQVDLTGTEQVFTVGGPADTWGRTWTVGDFTAGNFRVRLTNDNDNGTASIDHIQVNVHYGLLPEINVQGNGVSIADGDGTPSLTDFTDFGNVPQNVPVDRTFTIQNTGAGDLTIGAITFTGGDAGDFSVVTPPAGTVPPGGSTTFTVRLTAGGGGGATRDTTINIVNNDSNENPYNFAIAGTRITTEINVQGNGVNITDGDATPSLTDCTNFGSVLISGTIDCTYTIQNQGPNALYVGTVTLGGANAADFSVITQPVSPIANGGSTTFTVRFTPSAAGARNATVSFINNDTNESPYNWSIQGTGAANTPPTITSNGGGTTANINVAENTTAVTTVTASDPDVPPQTLTYSISGTDAGDFSIVPSTGVLTFSTAPNFESPADADANNSYIVTVQVSDGTASDSQTITVNVTNVNEAPTDLPISSTSIAENNAVNDVIGIMGTTDPDAGNTFTYSLACTIPGADDGSFNISGANLRAGIVFDFETKNSYAICIRTTDQGGLFYEENFTITITDVDEVPPQTTIDSATPSTSPTSSTTMTVAFSSSEVGSTFQCRLDGGAYAACVSPVNYAGLSDGSHTFEVYATDSAGNADPTPASYNWTVDSTAPDTNLTSTPSDPSNDNTPTFSFTSPDATATFQCRMDGGAYAACTSPAAFGPLTEGPHTFDVYAIDTVGNTDATPATYTWAIDLTSPDTSIDSTPANPSNDANPAFTFSSADATATFECQIDGGGFSACTSGSSFGPLGDGSHTFEVRAVDPAGNQDATPASYTWTVDGAAPAVTIDQAAGQADPANSSPINFTVVFSEPVSGFATGDVTLAGTAGATTAVVTETAPNDGTTYNVAVSGMSGDGTVIASIGAGVAVDASSNSNSASTSMDNTVTYNTSAPDTVIDSNPPAVTNNQNATFAFSSPAADLAGFECQLDGGGWSGCSAPWDYLGLGAGSHTFEVRAFDDAGNYDPSPASHTWTVDVGFPTVLFTSNTVPANNASLATGPSQITVEFSEDVKNDGSAGAANSIANYLLVEDGANSVFNTLACSAGLLADDTNIVINTVSYSNNGGSGPFIATLNVNGGAPLPAGTYRLFVCGTTSIEDLSGNELNDGSRDTTITFTVQPASQGGGGGGGGGGNSGGNTSTGGTTSLSGFLIPVTGFPQGEVTRLDAQPAAKAYASTEILIEIPKLGLKTSIVGVPQTDNGWDVSWLGRNAGWLNGSAFPTWKGNSVITAHVWDAYNKPGPFAGLIDLQYGDQIRIHAYGQIYTYEITESSLVLPSNISSAFRHEEKSVLTLITCEGYQEKNGTYTHRRMVRAVLVKVEQAK